LFSLISGSLVLLLHWRISDGALSFLGKRRQSVLVEPRRGLVSKRAGRGTPLPETRSFDGKFDVGAPSGERGGSAQKMRRKERERPPTNRSPKRPKKPRRNRYSVRTDSGPIALRVFWSMHVEAMNRSCMGHAECAAALGLSPHALRIRRDRLEESGNEMDWRSLLHPVAWTQLSSAANCARRKYCLIPEAVDGRSNRRRLRPLERQSQILACITSISAARRSQAESIAHAGGSKACTNGPAGTCLLQPSIFTASIGPRAGRHR
jgi:hypothetical protein